MTAEKDPERERSTMSRVDVPVSEDTRRSFDGFAKIVEIDNPEAALRYLDRLDEPSAHHRPRLNELLRCAKQGQLA